MNEHQTTAPKGVEMVGLRGRLRGGRLCDLCGLDARYAAAVASPADRAEVLDDWVHDLPDLAKEPQTSR